MTVESSFNYPSDLDASLPATNDARSEGDDHIRGIKSVLKTTLPNVNSAINASDEELNYIVGVTGAIQTQLNNRIAWTTGNGGSTTLSAARIQTYIATSPSATVTLPASPTSGDVVIVSSITTGVTIGRNGNNINGTGSNKSLGTNALSVMLFHSGNWTADNVF